MSFETQDDLAREQKAINTLASLFGWQYQKLDPHDIDYKILAEQDGVVSAAGYVEIKGRNKDIKDAYPLPVSASKIVKLYQKRLNPIIAWACNDGVLYAKLDEIVGTIRVGGRPSRPGAVSDKEVMAYFDKQKGIKYVKFL